MTSLGAAGIVHRQIGSWKGVVVVLQQGQVFKLTSEVVSWSDGPLIRWFAVSR
jgi:hypothetical protein